MAWVSFRTKLTAFSAIALALTSLPTRAQTHYLTDLGAVAPGLGINNAGQVVLQNDTYSNGVLTPLPAGMTGTAINASGQVTGSIIDGQLTYAAVDTGGAVTELPQVGILPGDSLLQNFATGINAAGTVIGWWEYASTNEGAFVISNGTVTNLVFPNMPVSGCEGAGALGFTIAFGINDSGQITGEATNPVDAGCASRAFIYDNGVWTDLGPGQGLAINANGQVTGAMFEGVVPNFYTVAFIYSNGVSTPIAPLAGNNAGISTGFAINATGQVVGGSFAYDPIITGAQGTERAFYFNGVTNDLNAFISATDPLQPFVSLTEARGINDFGVIVVNGVDSRTQAQHAYLLQAPLVTVAPGPLSFANQAVGTVSPAQSVTITNVGASAVALGAVTISNDYTETNTCATTLSAGGVCTVMVSFAPKSGGTPSGNLTVVAGGVPILVPVSGLTPPPTIAAHISATPTSVASGGPITISWTSTNATSCSSVGGGLDDGWPQGTRPTSGSVTITEPYALTAGTSKQLTFTINCTATDTDLSATSSSEVTQLAPTGSSSGSNSGGSKGGGALDFGYLALLGGLLIARQLRRAPQGLQTLPRGRFQDAIDRASCSRGTA